MTKAHKTQMSNVLSFHSNTKPQNSTQNIKKRTYLIKIFGFIERKFQLHRKTFKISMSLYIFTGLYSKTQK